MKFRKQAERNDRGIRLQTPKHMSAFSTIGSGEERWKMERGTTPGELGGDED